MLAHIPKSVIAKNFKTDIAAWNPLSPEIHFTYSLAVSSCDWSKLDWIELFVLSRSIAPPPADQTNPVSPAGTVPQEFSYPFSKITLMPLDGGGYCFLFSLNCIKQIWRHIGSVKVADSTVFTIAEQLAVAEVIVNPGAMRFVFLTETS